MAKTELQRLLSKLSIASRRDATRLILAGQVKINGRICRVPQEYIDTESKIEVTGVEVSSVQKHYLIFNKPKGLVVTRSDEKGRATVYEHLKNWNGPLLQAVGRLDMASEGLLLFTNDHVWANQFMDPQNHIKKIYHVQVSSHPTPDALKKLSEGIMLDGKKTMTAEFKVLRSGEKNCWLSIELQEGRNRQIRKMLETEKIKVLRLIRVQIGDIKLGDLPKGQWRVISK